MTDSAGLLSNELPFSLGVPGDNDTPEIDAGNFLDGDVVQVGNKIVVAPGQYYFPYYGEAVTVVARSTHAVSHIGYGSSTLAGVVSLKPYDATHPLALDAYTGKILKVDVDTGESVCSRTSTTSVAWSTSSSKVPLPLSPWTAATTSRSSTRPET